MREEERGKKKKKKKLRSCFKFDLTTTDTFQLQARSSKQIRKHYFHNFLVSVPVILSLYNVEGSINLGMLTRLPSQFVIIVNITIKNYFEKAYERIYVYKVITTYGTPGAKELRKQTR